MRVNKSTLSTTDFKCIAMDFQICFKRIAQCPCALILLLLVSNLLHLFYFLLLSQVKTRLHHPTKYHVQQKQKNQIQMFMQQDRNIPVTTQSLPDNMLQQQQQQHYTTGSYWVRLCPEGFFQWSNLTMWPNFWVPTASQTKYCRSLFLFCKAISCDS